MRASVTVRVPGSTSNLGAGFDCVGVAAARQEVPPVLLLTAESDIPVARGLGSSAAAVVAGAAAATALLGLGLGKDALAALCAGLEGHPDNVAPAIYGGANLVLREPDGGAGLSVTPLALHDTLALVFAVPT